MRGSDNVGLLLSMSLYASTWASDHSTSRKCLGKQTTHHLPHADSKTSCLLLGPKQYTETACRVIHEPYKVVVILADIGRSATAAVGRVVSVCPVTGRATPAGDGASGVYGVAGGARWTEWWEENVGVKAKPSSLVERHPKLIQCRHCSRCIRG